jgi:hypothetical protein
MAWTPVLWTEKRSERLKSFQQHYNNYRPKLTIYIRRLIFLASVNIIFILINVGKILNSWWGSYFIQEVKRNTKDIPDHFWVVGEFGDIIEAVKGYHINFQNFSARMIMFDSLCRFESNNFQIFWNQHCSKHYLIN